MLCIKFYLSIRSVGRSIGYVALSIKLVTVAASIYAIFLSIFP